MSDKESLAHVDRKTASLINPAICDTDAQGTCHNVKLAMRALTGEEVLAALDDSAFIILQDMLAAALEFEAAQEEPKEAPVTNISKESVGHGDDASGAA